MCEGHVVRACTLAKVVPCVACLQLVIARDGATLFLFCCAALIPKGLHSILVRTVEAARCERNVHTSDTPNPTRIHGGRR